MPNLLLLCIYNVFRFCVGRLKLSKWSAVHPASWYYNMYAKESIKRTREAANDKLKSKYILAVETVLGGTISSLQKSMSQLITRITEKAVEINEKFFKVILNIYSTLL